MGVAAYLFEIRQIQSYIFSTGKLRDASGASELIDSLSEDDPSKGVGGIAGDLIAAVFHKDLPRSYRSAGAVLDVVHDDEGRLRQFRAAFRLALARRAPGLVYSDSLATADDDQSARKAARNSVSAAGPIRGIRMPLGSPITRPAPKSGANPAILPGWSKGGKCKITGEFADLATQTVRKHLDEAKRLSLAEKFTPKAKTGLKWPTIFRKDEDGKEKGNLFPFEAGTTTAD